MKSQSYMTRALRARDPRFATILGKLGYERSDMSAAEPEATPEEPEPNAPEKATSKRRTSDKATS
jgi:hypothetical protein